MPYIASNGEKVYDYEEIFVLDMGDFVEEEIKKVDDNYNHFFTNYFHSKYNII